MNKYNIEGNISFYDELYKSLDDEVAQDTENDDMCLITNLPLTDTHFKMQCGHKFNYMPLFMDIKNHKQKFNVMEGSGGKLGQHQIRCPYCRTKHTGTLPYYEELGLAKINGVNFFDPNVVYSKSHDSHYNVQKCEFLIPNPGFNPTGDELDPSGNDIFEPNCKFFKCAKYGTQLNCYGDEKYYCYNHKKLAIKIYKKDASNKVKEQNKQEKLLKKEELLKQREETKQNEKLAKQKAKDEAKQKAKEEAKLLKKKKPQQENVVLHPIIIDLTLPDIEGCVEILRTGQKKGQQCNCKIEKDQLCKRHYNLKHHKVPTENKEL